MLHTSSIKDRSFLLANFTAEEVATLLEQHTGETGQVFADEVKAGIWELTRGQPWLVNALARQLVEVEVPDRATAVEPRMDASRLKGDFVPLLGALKHRDDWTPAAPRSRMDP